MTVSYFSDVLCVSAYVAQIKLDELRWKFGDRIIEASIEELLADPGDRANGC